jgi:hypothetical protein
MTRGSKGQLRDALATNLGAIPTRWLLVAFAFLLGILAECLYGFAARPWLATFSASLLFSLAALVAGGFFGFLFGLPQSHGSSSTSQHSSSPPVSPLAADDLLSVPASPSSDITASTNLQQVADWLTKLILGAGLTQLGRLPHASAVLFRAMSASIGGSASATVASGSSSATAVAGGIAIYFALLGFVTGWLATYFFLTPAMTKVHRNVVSLVEQSGLLAARANRLEAAGETDRADKLRAASERQSATAKSLIATYATAYARPRSDPSRIPDLDRSIAAAAREGLAADPTIGEVKAKYDVGNQREREVALAMMADDPSKADIDALVTSITTSNTAVEQYQALRAASAAAPHFAPELASQLRAAVQSELDSNAHFSLSSERYRLAQSILASLPE